MVSPRFYLHRARGPQDHCKRANTHAWSINALARELLTTLRDRSTDRNDFRSGLVDFGHICGSELLDDLFERERVAVQTPLSETTSERVIVLATVSAPEGIEHAASTFPDVTVVTVAIDDYLDENGFIVPGLGDAGDRAFGPK